MKAVVTLMIFAAAMFGVLGPQNALGTWNSIVGPWIVEVFPDPQPAAGSFKNLGVFTPDGGNINTDPAVGTGIGVWERVRNRVFKVKFFTMVSPFLPADSPLPFKPGSTTTVTATITLNHKGDRAEGIFELEYTDKSDNIVHGTGKIVSTRITLETPPP